MRSTAWKALERATAEQLGGVRNKRGGDFSQSMPDVTHPVFSVECKYRARIPRVIVDGIKQAADYDPDKVPLLVLRQRGRRPVAVLRLKDLAGLLERLPTAEEE